MHLSSHLYLWRREQLNTYKVIIMHGSELQFWITLIFFLSFLGRENRWRCFRGEFQHLDLSLIIPSSAGCPYDSMTPPIPTRPECILLIIAVAPIFSLQQFQRSYFFWNTYSVFDPFSISCTRKTISTCPSVNYLLSNMSVTYLNPPMFHTFQPQHRMLPCHPIVKFPEPS